MFWQAGGARAPRSRGCPSRTHPDVHVLEEDEQRLSEELKFSLRQRGVDLQEEHRQLTPASDLGRAPDRPSAHLHHPPVRLVHVVHHRRGVFGQFPDGVHVVVGDEQQVLGPWAEEDLVLEGHDHQLVKLQEEQKRVSARPHAGDGAAPPTRSMLAGFSLMMEAWATRVSTVFSVLWE